MNFCDTDFKSEEAELPPCQRELSSVKNTPELMHDAVNRIITRRIAIVPDHPIALRIKGRK